MSDRKTVSCVSRSQFKAHAKAITVDIDGSKHIAIPREFQTGSMGWNISTKMTIVVDGVPVTVQVGLNMTVVGSKELPHVEDKPTAPVVAPKAPVADVKPSIVELAKKVA